MAHNHSKPHVCQSNAGYYIGIFCPDCGPWDRLSWYVGTREEAERMLPLFIDEEDVIVEAPQQ